MPDRPRRLYRFAPGPGRQIFWQAFFVCGFFVSEFFVVVCTVQDN